MNGLDAIVLPMDMVESMAGTNDMAQS